MRSIVSYPERGPFGDNKYRGNCSGQLLLDLHKVYKFSAVSDYMRGSNTIGQAAEMLGIKSNTYDLNMGFDLVNDEIHERNEFIFWHPPYWDIIKYSGYQYGDKPLPNDLSYIADYNEFIRLYNYCLGKQFASLKTGGRIAILIADVKKRGKLYSILLDGCKLGTVEQIVIKEQHNCMSDTWKYVNNDFIRIAHEYLLILRRDNPYLYEIKITKTMELDVRDGLKITWKDLVASVLEKLGGEASLKDIYKEIDGHKKARNNPHWEEKVRQTLQIYRSIFESRGRGIWKLVAA